MGATEKVAVGRDTRWVSSFKTDEAVDEFTLREKS
jgi:hypothetical protein